MFTAGVPRCVCTCARARVCVCACARASCMGEHVFPRVGMCACVCACTDGVHERVFLYTYNMQCHKLEPTGIFHTWTWLANERNKNKKNIRTSEIHKNRISFSINKPTICLKLNPLTRKAFK